jgi:hypothetical protein
MWGRNKKSIMMSSGRSVAFVLHKRPIQLKNNIDFGFVFMGRRL